MLVTDQRDTAFHMIKNQDLYAVPVARSEHRDVFNLPWKSFHVAPSCRVVGFSFPFSFCESSCFRAEGSSGALEPLFAHSSDVFGGSFTDLFTSKFASEDQLRETQEGGPGRAARRQRAQPSGSVFEWNLVGKDSRGIGVVP